MKFDSPLFDRIRVKPGEDRRRSEGAANLQGVVRQGQPVVSFILPRTGIKGRTAHPRQHQEEDRAADSDGRPRGLACRAGCRSLRRAADSGVSVTADGSARRRWEVGSRGEYQEGPVSIALGYRECGGKSRGHGK